MFVLSIVMMTICPILIAPLFNKFTPLPEGPLREKIEKLVSSLKFLLKKLFFVDGSTRSSQSNAMHDILYHQHHIEKVKLDILIDLRIFTYSSFLFSFYLCFCLIMITWNFPE